ncbi:MAG: SocA family protein [Anaerolineales bacterium]|nr:SocA family protein [Anaerolineales bacterium]
MYRQKLLNAVLFFAKETKRLNKTKLSKLLYFLDFEHFRQTGYPSIGLKYYAFDYGPLPRNFWAEIHNGELPEDLAEKVNAIQKIEGGRQEIEFRPKPKAEVDFSLFTLREQEILKKFAYIYNDSSGKTMSDISHEYGHPWEVTIQTKGEREEIDYLLAIDENSPIDIEQARESLHDYLEMTKLFNIGPTE